jgi:hypothetical protein
LSFDGDWVYSDTSHFISCPRPARAISVIFSLLRSFASPFDLAGIILSSRLTFRCLSSNFEQVRMEMPKKLAGGRAPGCANQQQKAQMGGKPMRHFDTLCRPFRLLEVGQNGTQEPSPFAGIPSGNPTEYWSDWGWSDLATQHSLTPVTPCGKAKMKVNQGQSRLIKVNKG